MGEVSYDYQPDPRLQDEAPGTPEMQQATTEMAAARDELPRLAAEARRDRDVQEGRARQNREGLAAFDAQMAKEHSPMQQAIDYDPAAKLGEHIREKWAPGPLQGGSLSTRSVESVPSRYSGRVDKALAKEEGAIKGVEGADAAMSDIAARDAAASAKAKDREGLIRSELIRAKEEHAAASKENMAAHQRIQDQMTGLVAESKQLEKDSTRGFTQPSFMQSIGIAIARGLGATIQGLTHGDVNPIGSQIDIAMQREKERQQFILENRRKSISDRSLLLAKLENTLGNRDAALSAYDAVVGQAVEQKLKNFAESSRDPRVKATLEREIVERQQKNSAAEAGLYQHLAGQLTDAEQAEQAKATRSMATQLKATDDIEKRSAQGWTHPVADAHQRQALENMTAGMANAKGMIDQAIAALSDGQRMSADKWTAIQSKLSGALIDMSQRYGLGARSNKTLLEKEEKSLEGVTAHSSFDLPLGIKVPLPSLLSGAIIAKPEVLIRRLKETKAAMEEELLNKGRVLGAGHPTPDNLLLGYHLQQDAGE